MNTARLINEQLAYKAGIRIAVIYEQIPLPFIRLYNSLYY